MNKSNVNSSLFQFPGTFILLVVILVAPIMQSYTGIENETFNYSVVEIFLEEELSEGRESEKKEKTRKFEVFDISTTLNEQFKVRVIARLPFLNHCVFRSIGAKVLTPPPEHLLVYFL